jgi:hypothetical protein
METWMYLVNPICYIESASHLLSQISYPSHSHWTYVYIYIHLVSWISIEPIFQQKNTQKLHPINDVTWPTSLDMVRIQGNSPKAMSIPSHPRHGAWCPMSCHTTRWWHPCRDSAGKGRCSCCSGWRWPGWSPRLGMGMEMCWFHYNVVPYS